MTSAKYRNALHTVLRIPPPEPLFPGMDNWESWWDVWGSRVGYGPKANASWTTMSMDRLIDMVQAGNTTLPCDDFESIVATLRANSFRSFDYRLLLLDMELVARVFGLTTDALRHMLVTRGIPQWPRDRLLDLIARANVFVNVGVTRHDILAELIHIIFSS